MTWRTQDTTATAVWRGVEAFPAERIAEFHAPFHAAIEALLEDRRNAGQETILVTVHSFTPVYKDVPRPWPIGLIHGGDEDFTRRLQQALNAEEALAARQILAKSGNELVNLARKVKGQDNPGDDVLADFNRALQRHVAIQRQVSGATAEAGA